MRKEVATATTTSSSRSFADGNWQFAILLGSRAPLVALSDLTYYYYDDDDDDSTSNTFLDLPGSLCPPPDTAEVSQNQFRLKMPTVHVHGLGDPGLDFHRTLLKDFTVVGSAEVVQWDGDHSVPIKKMDVDCVVQATLRAAKVSSFFFFFF